MKVFSPAPGQGIILFEHKRKTKVLYNVLYSDDVQQGGAIEREKFLEKISALGVQVYQTVKVSKVIDLSCTSCCPNCIMLLK